MKRSLIGPNSFTQIKQKLQKFYIPKCQSFQQFFALKNTKRKKKNNFLACSMTMQSSSFKNQSIKSTSLYSISQQKIHGKDTMTSMTDCTSTGQKIISFKKNSLKQKLNKNQSTLPENLHKSSCSLKKQVTQPRVPVVNLSKIKSNQTKNTKKWSLQDFQIIRKIGQGSYSQVFLAIQKQLGFVCCIKMINKKSIIAQNILHVLLRQLKIHHYINHKNVVQLYTQFDDQEYVYLVQQYCTEGDLYKYLKHKNQLSDQIDVSQVSVFVKQICQAVAVMHKDSLMHRDIKPENVFLTFGNVVKLGDFGWSVYYGDHGLRNTKCGTPLYLAPQLVNQNQYSETVDIWAIGILTYELLTGQIPFKIRGTQDMNKILNQAIKFQYIQNDLARDFVMKLLQRDVRLRMEIEDVLEHPFLKLQEND